jgi:hypothetical protein
MQPSIACYAALSELMWLDQHLAMLCRDEFGECIYVGIGAD